MPHTITRKCEDQILGGIFPNYDFAQRALNALQDLCISELNIQVIQLNRTPSADPYVKYLVMRGFDRLQARFYEKALQAGRVLVVIYKVVNSNPVINIFHRNKATYRLRQKRSNTLARTFF
jgi:hypothetical protein